MKDVKLIPMDMDQFPLKDKLFILCCELSYAVRVMSNEVNKDTPQSELLKKGGDAVNNTISAIVSAISQEDWRAARAMLKEADPERWAEAFGEDEQGFSA